MAEPDIRLLFGVLGDGSIAEGTSGGEIKKRLDEIISAINQSPLKVKVALDTESGGQRSWSSQLQNRLNAISTSGKFAVQISKLSIGNGAVADFKKQLGAVLNTLNLDKGTTITLSADGIGEIKKQFEQAGESVDAAARKAAEFKVQMEALGRQKTAVQKTLSALGNASETAQEKTKLAELTAQYEKWAVKIEAIRAAKVAASSEAQVALIAEGEAIRDNIAAVQKSIDAEHTANQERMATLNDVISAYKRINDYINKNPRIVGRNEYTQLVSLRDDLAGVISATENDINRANNALSKTGDILSTMSRKDLREVLTQFSQLDTSLAEAGRKGKTLGGIIEAAYKKFGGWMIVTKSLMMVIHGIGQMVENVRDLDAAMTELRKVTNETEASYRKFFNEASERAKRLGATFADTINATADFARLGYSLNEAADLADAALVYKNVGDGISDIGDASSSVISTMKAFNIEASNAMSIVDKFNEVGNNFAISSAGVGDALLRSASSLAAANNTLDESIALVTAANNVIQDPDKVGTALKTVSMFLRAAKTEVEEAGESTEGMAESVSELRGELLMLTKGRVDIQIDADTFKSTYQILKELSMVWEDLTDITQANILEKLGGKRNSNVVMALLSNFETAEDVLKTAADSAGSALAENEKYIDSINGKIARFQASFEDLSSAVIDSGFVKGVIDFVTSVIDGLTAITERLGALPALITAIAGAATIYSGSKNHGNSFGLFGLIDGSIGVDPSGIRGVFAEFNKLAEQSNDIQASFAKKLEASDATLAGYLKTVKGGNATLAGYKTYCKQAGVETNTLGATSKIAAAGVTVLNTALNMIISLGVTLVIQGIITAITHLVNASDEAIERTKALNEAFGEFKSTNRDNISTLESLKDEFETLSHGVSRYGENVALTSDEYDRYKEIVQKIVEISPALSEGYSIENGHLADKNELIERAIALQEQQYQQELRQMTTTDKLVQGVEGYVAAYGKLKNSDILTTDTDFSNNIWRLFRINDRDVKPEFSGNYGDDKSIYLSEQILKALGVTDIGSEIEKYTNEHGYYQWGKFWDDYADKVAQNVGKLAASIDYSEAGFESLSDFEAAIAKTQDAADEYVGARDELEQANKDVANQLKLIAQSNEAYADLGTEAQGIVSHFIDQFGVEDVSKTNWWGQLVPDEDAIVDVKVKINNFIEKLTPEIQNAITGMFDLKGLFDSGDISVDEFRSTVEAILNDLAAAGFDDETIKYLRLSLETDMLDEQLRAVKEAIGGLEGEYDDALGRMTSQEIAYAYKIVAEKGSMTFDELKEKLDWLKYANADMVDVLDFSGLIKGLDSARDGLDSIISAMDRLRDGTALTKQEVANLALQYPKLLEQADLFVDGSLEGQRTLLNSILEMNEAQYDAQLDEKIAELKATEQVINDQLAMETEKANIIAEIKNMSVNGEIEQEEALIQKMNELNDLQGRNYVSMQDGELVVNQEALNQKLSNEAEYGQQATENIWEPFANTITSAHTQGYSQSLAATNSYGTSLFAKIKNIASSVWSALGSAVKDATTGNWKGISAYFNQAAAGIAGSTSIDAGEVNVTFGGGQTYVGTELLSDWISRQEEASKQRIEALKDFQQRTINTYRNLEALRGLDLVGIYGSAGSGSSSKSSSSKDSSSKDKDGKDGDSDADDTVKEVEEYIADIDAYYAAIKRLEEMQERRSSLEKELKYAIDPSEKVELSRQLIQAYKDEADAERNLMDLKRNTITQNVGALRALGFEVEYNAESNRLFIKNLEHLNELTASSAGEYDTLQEATNALRKETESLIDATEKLNDDNIEATSTIEDLGYEILDTKNNIIDYIEEIYDKQVSAYQKIIDMRKELIKSAKDEYDYESDVADKVKEIAELQARIDQLSLDDSRSARAERNSLMQQLAEKQKDLADTQADHSMDAQLETLDKMAEDYEQQRSDELDVLRNTVYDSEELWTAFYQTILGQNVSIGDSINTEIAGAWIRAAEAVREYSASVLGATGGGAAIVSSVTMPRYHSGGIVDESNLDKNEVLAILQKGEMVLNEAKQQGLYRIINFQEELSKRLGTAIHDVPVAGASPDANGILNTVAGQAMDGRPSLVFEPHIEVYIEHDGSSTQEAARAFGTQIADTAIDKLYEAFERRGVSSTRSSRLKP
ncbi:MAG: phage tail tape measure protein [Lachnospiraceae bacterium]|nr:phage tail tape measure protein [Lachnospiraceae bacterium]MCM1233143.1 phage tail tape measure protein [Ruminococcus flavefaciens]